MIYDMRFTIYALQANPISKIRKKANENAKIQVNRAKSNHGKFVESLNRYIGRAQCGGRSLFGTLRKATEG